MIFLNIFSLKKKLENLSKEELIKLIKKYILLQKQLKQKNLDLENEYKIFKLDIYKLIINNDDKNSIDQEPLDDDIKNKLIDINKQLYDLKEVVSSLENSNINEQQKNVDLIKKVTRVDDLKMMKERVKITLCTSDKNINKKGK